MQSNRPKPRVVIIGAGAAGIACAWSLAKADVTESITVIEAGSHPGGVATTIDASIGGKELRVNIGVQGGAYSYNNVKNLHDSVGKSTRVDTALKVSFGKGQFNWTNISDNQFLKSMRPEIARFGSVLRWIYRLEPFTAMIPIDPLLRLLRFSETFRHRLVIPLVALFFGTGNRTSNVSAALIARVFHDTRLRLFDYDPERFLSETPKMFAFSPLEEIYALIAQRIYEYSDKHRILTNCQVVNVDRRAKGVQVTWVKKESDESYTEHFDHVVFACGAEATLKILSTKATFFERWVLGNVRYYDDVTYTHTDRDYMNKHYSLKPESSSETPMYFIKSYEGYDLRRVEMSFNLCAYQPFLKQAADKEGVDVYQSIFLDAARDQAQVWTENEIDSKKIIAKTWWRQFAHDWTHYLKVVPFVSLIQGQSGCTWHCGSWTAANTHEIATVSGLAVAQRLGAAYPFGHDELASHQFNLYMFIAHEIFPSLGRKIKFMILLALISMLVYILMGF
jgi:predicted NAD/FAD-binding protein